MYYKGTINAMRVKHNLNMCVSNGAGGVTTAEGIKLEEILSGKDVVRTVAAPSRLFEFAGWITRATL